MNNISNDTDQVDDESDHEKARGRASGEDHRPKDQAGHKAVLDPQVADNERQAFKCQQFASGKRLAKQSKKVVRKGDGNGQKILKINDRSSEVMIDNILEVDQMLGQQGGAKGWGVCSLQRYGRTIELGRSASPVRPVRSGLAGIHISKTDID